MPRPLRIEYEDAVYHVMNRGIERRAVFLNDEDCRQFISVLEEACLRWKVKVFAYALLGNNYHLCLQTPGGNLARVMRHVDGVYTQKYNRAHRRDGRLFRGRYRAILVQAEEYLGAVVRYIHLNPVKAKGVTHPSQYPWSTHQEYLKKKTCWKWLDTEPLLKSLGGSKGFHAYVMKGNGHEIEKFYGSKRILSILGTEDFVIRTRKRAAQPKKTQGRRDRRGLIPSLKKILRCVADEYGVKQAQMMRGIRGTENEARQVAILLSFEQGEMTYGQIKQEFNIGSYGAIGWYCDKVRQKEKASKEFKKKLDRIRQRFCKTR